MNVSQDPRKPTAQLSLEAERGVKGVRVVNGVREVKAARVRAVIAVVVAALFSLGLASCAEFTLSLGPGMSSATGDQQSPGLEGSPLPGEDPLPDSEAVPLPADQQPLPEPGIPGVGQEGEAGAGGAAEARVQLASLQVKGRAPKNNYARSEFGQRWKDVDRNGCDQRNDVLARDMTQVDAPSGCKVLSGVLHDPYTGQTINFVRGQQTSQAVQIDHVVALADAWQKGAQEWTPEKREQFGNDTMNLLAVDGPQNQKKGAGDAATWLPPNKAFRCQYVTLQIRVKATYGLWVTTAERDAMDRELGRC
ncbi:hypothetical protein CUROG_00445 [Corynebacterium urogenitale]|uniref:GmrSD restriction endonucleases C-terminal domain-containing protein n=1 Tax=Corynebacterium urogenitale TaxID=2487892 RepID=A0A5J6Z738_9CORY|nr:HNH endonuclease family protein [Corynebacterium urogenitale]QFQ01495.1 hypothetical protein CUROG_00445 [Corynebacterium urogenitale]